VSQDEPPRALADDGSDRGASQRGCRLVRA